jgi:hypothetical protein
MEVVLCRSTDIKCSSRAAALLFSLLASKCYINVTSSFACKVPSESAYMVLLRVTESVQVVKGE